MLTSSPPAENSPPGVQGSPHTGQGFLKCPRSGQGHIWDTVIQPCPRHTSQVLHIGCASHYHRGITAQCLVCMPNHLQHSPRPGPGGRGGGGVGLLGDAVAGGREQGAKVRGKV